MSSYLLLESGDRLQLESGDFTLLEQQPVITGDYLVQESDGTSRFTLEDGSGFILLEQASPTPPVVAGGGGIVIQRRVPIIRRYRGHLEEDEAIALSILLRTRRRRAR